MELLILLLVLAAAFGGIAYVSGRRATQKRELEAAESFRKVRVPVDEDVTRFGEELSDLHIETLTDELDTAMRQDYQRALDSYEQAKQLLKDAQQADDLKAVTTALEDGRYAMACVLARRDGRELPTRRPPCFFNPNHGPADRDINWAPPGGVEREVPVCAADADRVRQGAEPDVRKVRDGNRMVPYYEAGPAYGAYAQGYFGGFVMSGILPAMFLTSMMMPYGGFDSGYGDGGDMGGGDVGGGDGGDGGGDWGGMDASGSADAGGGFDFGGFDF
ncbi:hypothetical protein [Nocardioides sp. CFH 31398]|uniref:hypothetical protein n=1 Tax=Nocardioides sp. CFH 31398 TaxID=2919579 RepID=UPI001F05BAF6|nr:hypothetical protein [Nocardioides sp. CFH 31398]MCH1866398.1 hypothetical protein [Nocardioides sp. CFH 31398]